MSKVIFFLQKLASKVDVLVPTGIDEVLWVGSRDLSRQIDTHQRCIDTTDSLRLGLKCLFRPTTQIIDMEAHGASKGVDT